MLNAYLGWRAWTKPQYYRDFVKLVLGKGKEKKEQGIVVRVRRKDGIWCNIDNMYVSEGILGLVWGVGEIYVSF